jgi:multidrug transporter EmrE-like cation transporter
MKSFHGVGRLDHARSAREIGWAVGLKYSAGFTRPVPRMLTAASIVASLVLLGLAMRALPVGTAYATWTGMVQEFLTKTEPGVLGLAVLRAGLVLVPDGLSEAGLSAAAGAAAVEHHSPIWSAERQKADSIEGIGLDRCRVELS